MENAATAFQNYMNAAPPKLGELDSKGRHQCKYPLQDIPLNNTQGAPALDTNGKQRYISEAAAVQHFCHAWTEQGHKVSRAIELSVCI
jgi:hypothetical protein